MPDEQQIAKALADLTKKAPNPQKCWAQKLEGDSYQFLLAVEKLEREGSDVGRAAAARKFKELFDVEVSRGMVSYHLIQSCSCSKERDY